MRIDVASLMEEALTVACRTTEEGSDVWRTTIVRGFWHEEAGQTASGWEMQPSMTYEVQFPECEAGGYVQPSDYDGEGWTLRPGDRVARGEADCEGDLTALLEAFEGLPNFIVANAKDLRLGTAPGGDLSKWTSIVWCEGE